MVDQLAQEYTSAPVVFLEYYAPSAPTSRYSRFWAAFDGTYATYPITIADSGHKLSAGVVDYYHVFKSMVEAELVRPPQADIQAAWQREENRVQFTVQVRNRTQVSLSAANTATVHAVVYEDAHVGVTGRYVRSAVAAGINEALAPGATQTFSLETPDLSGVNWDGLHYIAMVDYRPGGWTGAYDMLQAAWATP